MSNESEKEQLWKIYELLPKELQDAIFSTETADAVWNVCEKYDINEVNKLAKCVGDSLLGLLPPEKFQAMIEKILKLDKQAAERVFLEIDRFIFYPVRPLLDKLYHPEIASSSGPPGIKSEIKPDSETEKTLRKDSYREPIKPVE